MRITHYPAGNSSGAGLLYGGFSDTTSQSPAAANTAYPITMNTTDIVDGVYLDAVHSSRVICPASGVYNFQFSLQLQSSSASSKVVAIWARVDGSDIANSATDITIQGSSTQQVAAWNFVMKMNAGQYFELIWSSDDTNVSLYHTSAQTSPYARPAIPSVILTVSQVS
jgi:hypothetical protein